MRSKPIAVLFGVLALVAVIAMAQPAFAADVPVTISKGASTTNGKCDTTSCFNPQVVTARVGDTVTWTNADNAAHTATYYDGNMSDTSVGTIWDSSMIKAGATYTSPAFTKAGLYPYFCQVHPWMTGQIVVGSAASSTQSNSSNNVNMGNMTANAANQTVPEFGPVASLVLVIAIISVVVFTAKTRAIPKL